MKVDLKKKKDSRDLQGESDKVMRMSTNERTRAH